MPEAWIKFGATVKKKRLAMGISQEELGYRAGLHRNYVSDLERGKYNVTLDTILKLAHGLDCFPTDLVKGLKYEETSL